MLIVILILFTVSEARFRDETQPDVADILEPAPQNWTLRPTTEIMFDGYDCNLPGKEFLDLDLTAPMSCKPEELDYHKPIKVSTSYYLH